MTEQFKPQEQVEGQKKPETVNKPESTPESGLPKELTLNFEVENIPEGWTEDDIIQALDIATLEQHQDFVQKMAERLGKEDYEIEEVLLETKKKALSSLGEYMSWDMFNLGSWEKLEAGINEKRQLQEIQENELADDWAKVVSAGDAMRAINSEIRKIDKELAELEQQKKPKKTLNDPQKPSFFTQLKDSFSTSRDTALGEYHRMLAEDEETKRELEELEKRKPEIKAKIAELKSKQDDLTAKEGVATKRYNDTRRMYFAKADALLEEKKPGLEKAISDEKQKFQQLIGYLYNALYYQSLPKDPNDWVGHLDKDGMLPTDYEEPKTPDYLTSTSDRVAYIQKDLLEGDGWARDFLLGKLEQISAEQMIKENTGKRVDLSNFYQYRQ